MSVNLEDVMTEERVKAYCDLPEQWQADALADARARSMRGAVNQSRDADDLAQCAVVYASPALRVMLTEDGDSLTASRENRRAIVLGAFATLDKRRADDDALVDITEPVWRDRLVAPDTYSPESALGLNDTASDLVGAALAGADDATRDHLAIAARQALADDKTATRVRRSGYVMPADTVGRLGLRLREATGASKRTAERHLAAALDDVRTVAPHGAGWLRQHKAQPLPSPIQWGPIYLRGRMRDATPAPMGTPTAPITTGVKAPPFRTPGAIASPVVAVNADKTSAIVYVWREDGKTEDGEPLRLRYTITTAEGADAVERLLSQPWPITEGALTEDTLDKIGNAYVTASTGRGPVKQGNPRKGNRRGSMGATVPMRHGKGGALTPAGDMRPSVKPFRTGNGSPA